ncbi:hypothetical protein [Pedobacter lusitanus]|uniref:hypothetical protein n=1 Tax=Pedobacter lusitanus TaxID=1503925 RepID=UPI001269962F|nr:hypothetical protein [Pedobacter lusitanus]
MANLQILRETVTPVMMIGCRECGKRVSYSDSYTMLNRSFCSIGCADLAEEKNQGRESINNLGEWE